MYYKIVTEKLKDRTLKYKQLLNGICYNSETPNNLIEVLEKLRESRTRIKVYYGDKKTGLDWQESYDILGRIGNSTGSIKIPLLVYNERSLGGEALLSQCIVKIESTKKPHTVYYQHPKYHKEA